jgi:Flp pilus assembly protein TadG
MNFEGVAMRKKSAHLVRGEQGQTLMMFVLFMIVLIVFIGLGVDMGFAYITRSRLSKAVDSACLTGMRNLAQGQTAAANAARAAFSANYGTSGRDVAPPNVTVTFGTVNKNIVIDVGATVSINTYFIRVLPLWKTLAVGSSAEATRADVIMTVVLDRSGSMHSNGGDVALPPAVTSFISNFDDVNDIAAMVSFASAASVDVPMQRPFITKIENAAGALSFGNTTCSDEGLTNALAQNNTVTITPGQDVIKVIVFFTDGMANTFNCNLNCGNRNLDYTRNLYDPTNQNSASTGCTIPNPLMSIDGVTQVDTSGGANTCDSMHYEAQRRAEAWANQARSQTNFIYCVGLGNPGGNNQGECNDGVFPILNPAFLKAVANTPDSATYNPNQPVGDYAIAADFTQLQDAFNTIARKILLRLSK